MKSKELLTKMNPSTQMAIILNRMIEQGSITSFDAILLCGCTRLAARISDLKALGVGITTEMETKGGRTYARYILTEGE